MGELNYDIYHIFSYIISNITLKLKVWWRERAREGHHATLFRKINLMSILNMIRFGNI
jgi:hypothetical protein